MTIRALREAPVASPPRPGLPPLSQWGFAAVAVASFGGPLALAALYAPLAVGDVASSATFVGLIAPVLFLAPLVIWLRYSRGVTGPGGLTAFVEAAAGARVARVQAALWLTSYVLYLVYTTAYVVYDVLPAVTAQVRPYRPLLEVLLPVVIAGVVVAGRGVTIGALGVIAAGQVLLVGALDVVALRHGGTAGALAPHGAPSELVTATGGIAVLFVCGSLPLFLGGELARPVRTIRRWLPIAFAVTAVAIVLAVVPYALDPAFARAEIPGMSLAQADAGTGLATAIGLGVAASVVAVMVVEYVAVTRLLHALTGRPVRRLAGALAIPLVIAGPVSLLDPQRFYADLLRPSLIALWLSQLLVVVVYPRWAARRGDRVALHAALAGVAAAVIGFGLWSTLTASSGT